MIPPETSDPHSALLFQAALVCGAGANARSAVRQLTEQALLRPEKRSCIDGGSPLLLVVRSPGGRVFDVCVRQPDTLAGAQTWRRTRLEGFARESWYTRLFPGSSRAAFVEARDQAHDAQVIEEFERLHACLGANANPFLVSRQHAPDAERVWIGWQLEKHFHPATALAACDRREAWPKMAPVLESLLARPVPLRSSGWCVLAGMGRERTRIRLGTNQWSRVPETRGKIACFRKTVASTGGDPSFAEALYRLVLPDQARAGHFVRPVGCAVELEADPRGSVTADFFLRVPGGAVLAKLPTARVGGTAAGGGRVAARGNTSRCPRRAESAWVASDSPSLTTRVSARLAPPGKVRAVFGQSAFRRYGDSILSEGGTSSSELFPSEATSLFPS